MLVLRRNDNFFSSLIFSRKSLIFVTSTLPFGCSPKPSISIEFHLVFIFVFTPFSLFYSDVFVSLTFICESVF